MADWLKARQHPGGFREWELLHAGRLRITLHAWPPGSGENNIHSHRFSFVSAVLRGSLEESQYDIIPGTGYLKHDVPAGCKASDVTLAANPDCDVRLAARRVRRGIYAGRMGEFHQARVLHGPALTLFIKLEHRDSPDSSVLVVKSEP